MSDEKTVREAAQELGVSRQTIYNRLRKLQSTGTVNVSDQSMKDGQTLTLTEEQISLIKQAFPEVRKSVGGQIDSQTDSQRCKVLTAQIDSLTAMVDRLSAQNAQLSNEIDSLSDHLRAAQETARIKDEQIKAQNAQIDALHEQIKIQMTLTDQAQQLNAMCARQLERMQERPRRGLLGLVDRMRGAGRNSNEQ